jgi:hypothetical protein
VPFRSPEFGQNRGGGGPMSVSGGVPGGSLSQGAPGGQPSPEELKRALQAFFQRQG